VNTFAFNMSHFIRVFRNVKDINAATAITCTLKRYLSNKHCSVWHMWWITLITQKYRQPSTCRFGTHTSTTVIVHNSYKAHLLLLWVFLSKYAQL
jgi:hypothetical protein